MKTDYYKIKSENEASKSIILNSPPTTPEIVVVDILAGIGSLLPLRYDFDFTISDRTLSWAGGRFDGIISEEDEIRVIYY